MGADEFGDGAGKLVAIEHGYDDSKLSFQRLMVDAARGLDRVCKPEAHLYVCCDLDNFDWLRNLFRQYGGWSVFRTPIINEKVNSGRVPLPEHGPRRTYEIILYAFRGGKRVTGIYPDVMHTQGDEQLGHGAQKPIAMYADLLRRSARPGDRVLDPFAGTGTIFPAAHAHKVYATGIERDENSFGIAARRLAGLDAQGTLPTI
jgi:DNA modification methylase